MDEESERIYRAKMGKQQSSDGQAAEKNAATADLGGNQSGLPKQGKSGDGHVIDEEMKSDEPDGKFPVKTWTKECKGKEEHENYCQAQGCLKDFENGDQFVQLPCECRFHKSCYDKQKNMNKCPACQEEFD